MLTNSSDNFFSNFLYDLWIIDSFNQLIVVYLKVKGEQNSQSLNFKAVFLPKAADDGNVIEIWL